MNSEIEDLLSEARDAGFEWDQVEAYINQATWAALQGALARTHDPEGIWKPNAQETA